MNSDLPMGLEVGEIPLSDEQIGSILGIEGEIDALTQEQAIQMMLRGPQGPTGVIEPIIGGTNNHPMRARPEQLAKRRAKGKAAKQSRKINRRSK